MMHFLSDATYTPERLIVRKIRFSHLRGSILLNFNDRFSELKLLKAILVLIWCHFCLPYYLLWH